MKKRFAKALRRREDNKSRLLRALLFLRRVRKHATIIEKNSRVLHALLLKIIVGCSNLPRFIFDKVFKKKSASFIFFQLQEEHALKKKQRV